MEVNNWSCNSSCLTSEYYRIPSFNVVAYGDGSNKGAAVTTTTTWRVLWKKIIRRNKKGIIFFSCSSDVARVHVPYDAYTYKQNFDQGSIWDDDLDNVSRSFSARFAVPSRIFE